MSSWLFGVFPFCIPLAYSLGALCSFFFYLYIAFYRSKKINTCFFHKMSNVQRRVNHMSRIKVNGMWLIEENEIREGV